MDSLPAECQDTLNLIPEVIESGGGKEIGRLRASPGLALFTTLPKAPVTGIYYLRGRLFAAAGAGTATNPESQTTSVYEITANGDVTHLGDVGYARLDPITARPDPTQFFFNGNQIMVINGGYVWVSQLDPVTYTDLYAPAFGFVGSVAQPFTSNDLGLTLVITGGAGWRPGTYAISAVQPPTADVGMFSGGSPVAPAAAGAKNGQGYIKNTTFAQVPLTVGTYTDLVQGKVTNTYTDLAVGCLIVDGVLSGPLAVTGLSIGYTIALTGLTIGVPAISYTDLAISGGNAVTSAAYPFQPSQIGATLVITGGTGFTPGSYVIGYVNTATNAAVLGVDDTPGSPGATGGRGTLYTGDSNQIYCANPPAGSFQVGDVITFTAGTGFTTKQPFTILGVSGNSVTLNAPAGVIGSSGGTGSESPPNAPMVVTSSHHSFTGTDLGNVLVITATGGGFTAGSYTIVGLLGASAVLNASPGVVGSAGGQALEYTAGTENYVSSAAHPFQAGASPTGDANNYLTLTGQGAGGYGYFNQGQVQIESVANNMAKLSVPAGALGSTLGEGTEYLYQSSNQVSSQLSPFTQSDVGNTLIITGGTPAGEWFLGSVGIVSVDAEGYALLTNSVGNLLGAGGGQATETGADVTAYTGAFMDTYGIVAGEISPAPFAGTGTQDWYLSGNNTFLTWNAIDEAVKEGQPDYIMAMLADHEELYIFGDALSTEVWQDTGAATFPFQRMPAGFIHYGLAAQFSVAQLGLRGIAWLSWSAGRGEPIAVYSEGFNPQRISTHAIEEEWRGYRQVLDAIAYSETEDGHDCWVIHFPAGNPPGPNSADAPYTGRTWVYDLTASQQMGKPMWHRRGWWDGTTVDSNQIPIVHRQLQSCHTYGAVGTLAPAHYVGDRSQPASNTGYIYQQSATNLSDNGNAIVRQRTCPHSSNEELFAFWSEVRLSIEVGSGADITVTLDYSRDFGHTFVNQSALTAPNSGGYAQRFKWRRLGKARDLVLRFTSVSVAQHSWVDAYAEIIQGTS
jgi:hypothetical protein